MSPDFLGYLCPRPFTESPKQSPSQVTLAFVKI